MDLNVCRVLLVLLSAGKALESYAPLLLGRHTAVLIILHAHHAPPIRQLISRAAWYRLRTYFTKPITFQFCTPVCSVCENQLNGLNRQNERWREEAARQKARLPDLFKDTERPKWSKPSTTLVFLLNSKFMLTWRGFVGGLSAGKADNVGEMCLDTALDKATGSVTAKLKVLLSTGHTVPSHP